MSRLSDNVSYNIIVDALDNYRLEVLKDLIVAPPDRVHSVQGMARMLDNLIKVLK